MKESYRTCASRTCLKVDVKQTFKRCAKCRDAHYCSTQCQLDDWEKGNHRVRCKATRALRQKGQFESFSRKELDYIHAVVKHDFRTHFAHITHLMLTQYPDEGPLSLITQFDYTTIPQSISVAPLSSLHLSSSDPQVSIDFDHLVADLDEHRGNLLVIRATIPRGEFNTFSVLGCLVPSLEELEGREVSGSHVRQLVESFDVGGVGS
ncbi:hypothetical protein JAAARDRAFT_502906 [Jaapia argillacea MUCL 33604]|uniref:MYND-type domain-containing protein n=1 Tax=Jaapia argillacea MUCL 33604 TaxID=933084 RepID=A0A067P9W1_9AGAM|nr:hypothetical protein JAAARDRAFT_502906 [Jaapia argillacea MUCL 33604]